MFNFHCFGLLHQNRSLLKLVPLDQFWQKVAKTGPPDTKFGKHILGNMGPHAKLGVYGHYVVANKANAIALLTNLVNGTMPYKESDQLT